MLRNSAVVEIYYLADIGCNVRILLLPHASLMPESILCQKVFYAKKYHFFLRAVCAYIFTLIIYQGRMILLFYLVPQAEGVVEEVMETQHSQP